jgi:hypothetical protein
MEQWNERTNINHSSLFLNEIAMAEREKISNQNYQTKSKGR